MRKDKGIYAATRLNPTDDLHVILGSRLSWVDYDTQGPWETDRFKEDRKVIPYGGIVYDITDKTSVYASYTEIYKLQSNYSVDNKLLAPTTGSNYEIGLKNELFDAGSTPLWRCSRSIRLACPRSCQKPVVCADRTAMHVAIPKVPRCAIAVSMPKCQAS